MLSACESVCACQCKPALQREHAVFPAAALRRPIEDGKRYRVPAESRTKTGGKASRRRMR